MEYVYAAMLLHVSKQTVNEANVKKVLEAAGVKPEEGRVKALVGALEGVNIDEAIKEAAMVPVAAAPVSGSPAAKKEEKKEEKKNDEEAAAGLAGLFG